MDFCLPANAPLLLAFAKLPDPRKERNRLYPLIDIVAVVLMGVICAANDIMAAYLWAQHRKEWFVSMGLCLNGLPSYDTLNRVFRYLDPKAFNQCFMEWVHAVAGRIQGVIAIDGKTLCNSGDAFRETKPIHLINAFAAENQLILGQLATEAKSNEITAIPKMLEWLDVRGSLVTIDAMGCQVDIAQTIISKEGDYIFSLKGNQGSLKEDVQAYLDDQEVIRDLAPHTACDKGHGRLETRVCWVTHDVEWLHELHPKWSTIHSLIRIDSTREMNTKITKESRYYSKSMINWVY